MFSVKANAIASALQFPTCASAFAETTTCEIVQFSISLFITSHPFIKIYAGREGEGEEGDCPRPAKLLQEGGAMPFLTQAVVPPSKNYRRGRIGITISLERLLFRQGTLCPLTRYLLNALHPLLSDSFRVALCVKGI